MRHLLLLSLFLCLLTASAQDSLRLDAVPDSLRAGALQGMQEQKPGLVRRIINYYKYGRTNGQGKRIDVGILPGAHYSNTSGVGIGIVATGLYRAERADTTLTMSNANLYFDATHKGYFTIGLKGTHIFPKERFRLDYKLSAHTSATQIWGIGYDACDLDANETDYRLNRIDAMARFLVQLAPDMYVGPLIHYEIKQAREVEDPTPFRGQPGTQRAYTAGVSFTYDSRDFIPNAWKGVFLQVDQTFTPRALGNGDWNYSTTEFTLAGYRRVWRGGVLCAEGHGLFRYGRVPWAFMAEAGSNNRLRGYFEGRYRDKNILEGQVELRQHIRGRNSAVVWGGLAEVFPSLGRMTWHDVLPNAGVGYRWEFKPRVNVRIDLGLTRNGAGVIFGLQEAF